MPAKAICSIVALFGMPLAIGIMVLALYMTGYIPADLNWLVKILATYLPTVGLMVVLYMLGRPAFYSANRVAVSSKAAKSRKIRARLQTWNEKKFNPLGFSWTYCEDTDTLELSIDADLEVYEEKSEDSKKSLNKT